MRPASSHLAPVDLELLGNPLAASQDPLVKKAPTQILVGHRVAAL